jgi:calcineurin-like phosphoesterase family protein
MIVVNMPKTRLFFTSDTHFGDHRVLNIRPRPFSSVAEMNEIVVARWNARVGPHDEVWHLGDFAVGLETARTILPRLNGRKNLIIGNIDTVEVCGLPWASAQHYAELTVEGVMVVICHYPFRTWNGIHRGAYNLHGHTHGRVAAQKRQFDVGVDARDFQPVLFNELLNPGSP